MKMAENYKKHLHLAWQSLSEMIAQKTAEPVFPVKAVAGCLCVFAVLLYLPLGVLLFGGFLYLHLILRISARPVVTSDAPSQDIIFAPIDGQIVQLGSDEDGRFILFRPQFFDSHIIYAPIDGELSQHIYFSGKFDKIQLDVNQVHIPEHNMRHEYTIELPTYYVKLQIIASPLNRLISVFVDEGMRLRRREAIASALLQPLIMMHVPDSFELECRISQRCIGGDTPIARKL